MVMGSEETVTYLSPCAIWPETLQDMAALLGKRTHVVMDCQKRTPD